MDTDLYSEYGSVFRIRICIPNTDPDPHRQNKLEAKGVRLKTKDLLFRENQPTIKISSAAIIFLLFNKDFVQEICFLLNYFNFFLLKIDSIPVTPDPN